MSTSESLSQQFEQHLLDYLLSANPARLVVVGPLLESLPLPAKLDCSTLSIERFDTLAQCYGANVSAANRAGSAASELGADEASRPAARSLDMGQKSEQVPDGGAGKCVALVQFASVDTDSAGRKLEIALGRAVRQFPEQLVVRIDTPTPDDTAFYSFGFRKLQLQAQGPIRLFEYCLSDYKQPPDWLNARFWANPERFVLDEESDIYSEDGDEEEE